MNATRITAGVEWPAAFAPFFRSESQAVVISDERFFAVIVPTSRGTIAVEVPMIGEGIVKGRVVLLDPGVALPEGVRVRVEAVRPGGRPYFHPVGTWDGPPGELETLLAQVQQLRNAEMTEGDDGTVSP